MANWKPMGMRSGGSGLLLFERSDARLRFPWILGAPESAAMRVIIRERR